MIDNLDLEASVGLAQAYAHLNLDAVADTPLSALTRFISTMHIDPETATYESVMRQIVEMSRTPEHAALRQEIIDRAAASVRANLDVTRNKVLPHINRVIESFTQAMDKLSTHDILPFDIVQITVPEAYKARIGIDYLEAWAGTAKLTPEFQDFTFAVLTPEEVLASITLSDVENFNANVQAQLASNGGVGLMQIVEFLGGRRSYAKLDRELALPAVIALEAIQEPTEGVTANLGQWRTAKSVVTAWLAREALALVDYLASTVRNTTLYVTGKQDGIITVNQEVYRGLLKQGLTVEALIGNDLLNRPYYGMELVDPDNLAACLQAYQTNYATRKQAFDLDLRAKRHKLIRDLLRDDQAKIAEKNEFIVEGDTADKSWNRLRSLYDNLSKTPYLPDEPTLLISTLIIGTWYQHTDAARYVDLMFRLEKENPSTPAKELATQATQRYISEWWCSQITVAVDAPLPYAGEAA